VNKSLYDNRHVVPGTGKHVGNSDDTSHVESGNLRGRPDCVVSCRAPGQIVIKVQHGDAGQACEGVDLELGFAESYRVVLVVVVNHLLYPEDTMAIEL
jgi:hypothetical protein